MMSILCWDWSQELKEESKRVKEKLKEYKLEEEQIINNINDEISFENPLEDVIYDRLGNVFNFQFPKRNLRVRMDRITQDRYTSADIRVEYIKPLQFQSHHIFQSKANIDQSSGANGKTSMVKSCSTRADEMSYEEWDAIIEYACVSVLEAFREDELEPAVNLRDLKEPKDEGMLVSPILPLNEPSIIFGEGGTGKSLLSLWIGGLVSEGFGFDWISAKQKNVLYLDYETSEDEFKRRGDKLASGMGMDEPYENIWYRRYSRPLIEMVEHVRAEIDKHNIGFIVVDSAGYACPEPESSRETNKFFNAMRSLPGVTWLVIAHTSKESSNNKTPFGSVFWWNGARSIWEIKKNQDAGEGWINSILHHRKINNGTMQKSIGFNLKFVRDAVTINNADVGEIENYIQTKSRIEEIYQYLLKSKQKKTIAQVLEMLDLDESKLNSVRASMSRDERMIHFEAGMWGIVGLNYDEGFTKPNSIGW